MRLFQVGGTRPWYKERFEKLALGSTEFDDLVGVLHGDGFDGVHTLLPVANREPTAFYTHANDERMQRAWAREHGMAESKSLDDILLAQIEHHRPDAFYTTSTQDFDPTLPDRMPACVRAKIGFNASPSVHHDMSRYLMVCNFPTLLENYRRMGLRTAFFAPSHDPILDQYAARQERDIDVLFVGTYSRMHKRRAPVLEAVAALRKTYSIVFAILSSRLTRLADTPLGWAGPLHQYARPRDVRAVAQGPVYGRDYYKLLSRAKIVLNGAGDIGGEDRGNMRCWEALGGRTAMVSDAGNYPDGFVDGETMRVYRTPQEAVGIIEELLQNPTERQRIADAGNTMVRTRYSKERQWADFQKLVADHF